MNKVFVTIGIAAVAIIAIIRFTHSPSNHYPNDTENSTLPAGSSDFATWHELRDSETGLRLLMPRKPFQAKDRALDKHVNTNVDYQTYISAKDDGTIFSLNITQFPEKAIEYDQRFLENYIKELVESNPDNHLKSFNVKDYNGINAVDFVIENQNAIVKGKAFFFQNYLYVLSSTSKLEDQNQEEFEFFTNSLKLPPLDRSNNRVKTP